MSWWASPGAADEMIAGLDRVDLSLPVLRLSAAGDDDVVFGLRGVRVVGEVFLPGRQDRPLDVKGMAPAPLPDVLHAAERQGNVLAAHFIGALGRLPLFRGDRRLVDEPHGGDGGKSSAKLNPRRNVRPDNTARPPAEIAFMKSKTLPSLLFSSLLAAAALARGAEAPPSFDVWPGAASGRDLRHGSGESRSPAPPRTSFRSRFRTSATPPSPSSGPIRPRIPASS